MRKHCGLIQTKRHHRVTVSFPGGLRVLLRVLDLRHFVFCSLHRRARNGGIAKLQIIALGVEGDHLTAPNEGYVQFFIDSIRQGKTGRFEEYLVG